MPDVLEPVGEEAMKPDLIFESLCEVCGINWQGMTRNERGRVNAARKELVILYGEIPQLPEMIRERGASYKRAYPGMPLTPQALTKNWSTVTAFAKAKQVEERATTNTWARHGCPTCGDDHVISAGYDPDGYELTVPCPDCNQRLDATWREEAAELGLTVTVGWPEWAERS
jgi:endogenous inhibitor of DNA gyrase (YacG/DUF329 family)